MTEPLDLVASPFPPTAWTFLDAVPLPGTPAYREALNRLITAYWRPVFYFLRARGLSVQQAEDVTQGFFARFYERDIVRKADREKGRFRTFLLAVLRNYLSDETTRAPRQRRFDDGLAAVEGLLGDEERSYEPAGGETPEAAFNRRYAAELLREVRESLRDRCAVADCADWYEVFAAAHLDYGPDGPPSQETLAARLGLSRDQVRYRLNKVQDWFQGLLRARLRQEVGSDDEVAAEVRALQDALSPG